MFEYLKMISRGRTKKIQNAGKAKQKKIRWSLSKRKKAKIHPM